MSCGQTAVGFVFVMSSGERSTDRGDILQNLVIVQSSSVRSG